MPLTEDVLAGWRRYALVGPAVDGDGGTPACRDSAQRRCPRGARPRHRLPRTYHLPLQHWFIAARSTPPGPLKLMALAGRGGPHQHARFWLLEQPALGPFTWW